ncbi:MAG: hypothetical protein AMS21_07265 [Gemmatimonas sp. SG8_38_2]|nr:MAG: hypothetical protein AMS21_07265 [Gemmatimonas sp. SG8_38_2]
MLLSIPALGLMLGCAPSADSTLEENKALVRQYVDAYNSHDLGRLDDLMSPNFARRSQAAPELNSLEEFKADVGNGWEAFPDGHMEAHMMVAEGNLVAAYLTFAGTQEGAWGELPATGQRADLKFFYLFRVEGGKLAEMWAEWDNVSFLQQLGHFPESGT